MVSRTNRCKQFTPTLGTFRSRVSCWWHKCWGIYSILQHPDRWTWLSNRLVHDIFRCSTCSDGSRVLCLVAHLSTAQTRSVSHGSRGLHAKSRNWSSPETKAYLVSRPRDIKVHAIPYTPSSGKPCTADCSTTCPNCSE
jgi:hypothetical protein